MTMPSKSIGIHNIGIDNKKASKPLIEKRRRARINSSLAELKEIVVGTDKTTPSTTTRPPKLEKADILEMTVAFLKRLTEKQENRHGIYASGYEICAKEVFRFLEEEGCLNLKTRLKVRLRSTQLVSNNTEFRNTTTDDSMSCSSRSQTPSTVGMDNSQMEYSSCSPFTDTEQEVPSTSSSALLDGRTFPTHRNESYYDSKNFVERLTPECSSPNSCQNTMSCVANGPLNLATSPKKVLGDDAITNQVLQSRFPVVNNGAQDRFSPPVIPHNCNRMVQDPNSRENNPSRERLDFPCYNHLVWRPW